MQYITVYNPDWPARFVMIADRLTSFLPPGCRLHHVGSTSVPGMPAKDIIDLDIECPRGTMPTVIAMLVEAGYEHQGDKGIPGREAFRPSPGSEAGAQPAHHLYACEAEVHELRKHLAYRDYLIAHPDRACWLAQQKTAVDASAASREAYIEGKAACYATIVAESLAWARAGQNPIAPERLR